MSAGRNRWLKLVLGAAVVLAPVLVAAPAPAAPRFDPLGFHIQIPAGGLAVHENAGSAVITVTRDAAESLFPAQVRYITSGEGYNPATHSPYRCGPVICTATSNDFTWVKGELDFQPGQTSMTFSVPIADHGIATVPKTLIVSLYGPSPIGLGSGYRTTLTILEDDPAPAIHPGNRLGLADAPAGGNPLAGARFFVDPRSEAAAAARSNPALRVIAGQPGTARFGLFSYSSPYVPNIAIAVSRYLTRVASTAPGTVPLLATYRLVHGVHGNGDPPAEQAAYHGFITGFARGIGTSPAVLFLEMDALITTPGLNAHGVAVRMAELRDAINVLTANCPRLVIYLDAGAADALHARNTANLLNRAGVSKIQGFLLNATHFDRTSREVRYGDRISSMTGGKHFVINTGENGRGPLRPRNIVKQGLEVLCNPVGRGLGPKPTSHTGYPKVDMFAWTTNPGESAGQCYDQPGYELPGAPRTGRYWPKYARMLVQNANFRVS
jgi:endoglucanase